MSDPKKPTVGPQLRKPTAPIAEAETKEVEATLPDVKETAPPTAASVEAESPPVVSTPVKEPEVKEPVKEPAKPEPPKEPAKPELPRRGTVTAESLEIQVEKSALSHLHAIQKFPAGTCTIRDFRKDQENLDAVQARQVLDSYVTNGLVTKSWHAAAGRYTLTEAGVAKYHELGAKFGQPE